MSIKDILENSLKDRCVISVYYDSSDWSNYIVGYVDLVSEYHVRFLSLDKYGRESGYEIRSLSDIVKIETCGQYEKKIQNLANNQDFIFRKIELSKEQSDNLFIQALKDSIKYSAIIGVVGGDSSDAIAGYVDNISIDTITVRLINEWGEFDGFSVLKLSEITAINFNTQSQQIRNFLNKELNP